MATITQLDTQNLPLFRFIPTEHGSQDWLEKRKNGIGGSDAAAALGKSQYKSQLQLWNEKLGQPSGWEGDYWTFETGKALEPVIRKWYADKKGLDVIMPRGVYQHTKHDFMFFTPDGYTENNGVRRGFEAKKYLSKNAWGDAGSDELPTDYLFQVHHGMIVMDIDVFDIAVSFFGAEPIIFTVEKDEELHEYIVEGEREFWDMVKNKKEPEPVTSEDLKRKFNMPIPTNIIATPEIATTVNKLSCLKDTLKTIEKEKESLENKIKLYIGNNEQLNAISGESLVTWKQRKGARRLNGKRLEKENPIIYNEYLEEGEPTRTFLVK